MILHSVNKSPYVNSCMENCLNLVVPGDAVILIEDGVYGATSGQSPALASIEVCINKLVKDDVTFFALQTDFEARGLNLALLMPHFTLADDTSFVDLVARADKTLSWY